MWSERLAVVRACLRGLNGLGSHLSEDLWSAACGVTGRLPLAPTKAWSTPGGQRVLVVAPHPDDEAMGCAGTLLRHREAGDEVTDLVLTDGARSRALGLDGPAMARRREAEARAAVGKLGANLQWVGLSEGSWTDEQGGQALMAALRRLRPHVVYAPSALDFHPEHRRVARALAANLAHQDFSPEVRIYAVQVPLTPFLANLIHDVSDLEASIHDVLACYATQAESVERTFRLRRYAARFYGFQSQGEGFLSLSAQRYIGLQRRPDAAFRALRIRAWTDPLALLVGGRERLAWRSARAQ